MRSSRNSAGWTVAMAALAINLILGILYFWSVIQKSLVNDLDGAILKPISHTHCV